MTNDSVVLNKASIEVAKPKEGTNLLDIRRLRPLQNSINLFRVHFDPVTRNDHSKEIDFCDSEATLLGFDEQVIIT